MKSTQQYISYCSNIHQGHTWEEHFKELRKNVPSIIKAFEGQHPFGLGLRLSHEASELLIDSKADRNRLLGWLNEQQIPVLSFNGFPYGVFHSQRVKDQVHAPDWADLRRLTYTLRLFTLLKDLPLVNKEAGISTSPLTYKPWFFDKKEKLNQHIDTCMRNLIQLAWYLHEIENKEGVFLHLDIEPEPDGFLENSHEVVTFFSKLLLPLGRKVLKSEKGISGNLAETILLRHLQVCYDVCHFALVYEHPKTAMSNLKKAGIQIGKVQISSAIKTRFDEPNDRHDPSLSALRTLADDVYLHQVREKQENGAFVAYRDLPEALKSGPQNRSEWRTHFHVPIFLEDYGPLQSTQSDILDCLAAMAELNMNSILEVETYTWEVLPDSIRWPIQESVVRELNWLDQQLGSGN